MSPSDFTPQTILSYTVDFPANLWTLWTAQIHKYFSHVLIHKITVYFAKCIHGRLLCLQHILMQDQTVHGVTVKLYDFSIRRGLRSEFRQSCNP